MWKKIIAAVGCGVLLLGGSPAMAADSQHDPVKLYKDACLANIDDERALTTSVDLFGPNYHWEMDASGRVMRDSSMNWCGNMSWDYTDNKTKATSHEDIPFYMEQQDGVLHIYAQRQDKWGKISMPGIPKEMANVWKAGAVNYIEDSMQAVKNVSLQNETDKNIGLRVVMDAGKMMQVSEKYLGDGPANLSAKEKQAQKEMMANIAAALTGTELTMDWVMNKSSLKTVTISMDLTPLIRSYAKSVINDMAAGKIKLSNDEREMMESLGYFSELKFYLTYSGVKTDEKFAVPDEVRKSAVELFNMTDIQKGVSEAAQTGKN